MSVFAALAAPAEDLVRASALTTRLCSRGWHLRTLSGCAQIAFHSCAQPDRTEGLGAAPRPRSPAGVLALDDRAARDAAVTAALHHPAWPHCGPAVRRTMIHVPPVLLGGGLHAPADAFLRPGDVRRRGRKRTRTHTWRTGPNQVNHPMSESRRHVSSRPLGVAVLDSGTRAGSLSPTFRALDRIGRAAGLAGRPMAVVDPEAGRCAAAGEHHAGTVWASATAATTSRPAPHGSTRRPRETAAPLSPT